MNKINIILVFLTTISTIGFADTVSKSEVLYTNDYGYSVRNAVINNQSETYINPENHKKISIFGKDEREVLFADEERYFNFIRMVENGYGTVGTGFIVGKNCDVLLTNAHILYDTDKVNLYINGKIKSPGSPLKSLKYFPNDSSIDNFIKAVVISSGLLEGNFKNLKDDWTVLRLIRPSYKSCNRKLEFDFESNACNDAFLVGYHGDSLDRKFVSFCKYRSYSGNMVMHNCDSKAGASGSPLFCRKNDTNKIVGLNDGATQPIEYKDPVKKGASSSLKYSNKHYNHAIKFRGEFLSALKKELSLSKKRAK